MCIEMEIAKYSISASFGFNLALLLNNALDNHKVTMRTIIPLEDSEQIFMKVSEI